jgi:hypothetical protein
VLPKYPLPTHKVVWRGGIPISFSQSIDYDETQESTLMEALLLGEAISDLPEVIIQLSNIPNSLHIFSYSFCADR